MESITPDDINAVIDFIAACMLIGCHCLGWIVGSFR